MMRFGCQLVTYGDVERTLRYAVRAEECGFDTVTVPDHLFHPLTDVFLTKPPWDAFAVLAAIAVQTERVRLMPAVADSVRRHPAVLAHMAATLDHLSRGRMILGLGAGEAYNVVPLADSRWDRPYARFREALALIRALWASTREEPVSFEGEYFNVEGAHQSLKPVQQPGPPIYVGGYGPRMRSLTGAEGDGWVPWIYSAEAYREDLRLIQESARRAGRDPSEVDATAIIPTVVLPDADRALELALPRNRMTLALRGPLLRRLGYPELADRVTENWRVAFTGEEVRRVQEVAAEIPLEAVEKVIVAGTAEDAVERIDEYRRAGVSHFIALPLVDAFEETAEAFRDQVIPYFRGD